jgi:hypothetical protein
MLSVDPADDCTFWYTQEYYATTGSNWQTRIGSFKFPSCGATTPDTTPPTNPTVSSTSHTANQWSSDNTVNMTWSGATDTGGSGVKGVSFLWSQNATDTPDTTVDATGPAGNTTSPALADGLWYFHLATVDNAGNWSSAVHTGPFKIDTAPPTASINFVERFQNTANIPVSWTGSDGTGSGVASYDVTYQQAPFNAPFGSTVNWQTATAATSAVLNGQPAGSTTCFYVRAKDLAGNIGPVSAFQNQACSNIPLDDRAMSPDANWSLLSGASYYFGTFSKATTQGATLTRGPFQVTRLGVIATVCPGCGSVQVVWNGTVLTTINLNGATTQTKKVFLLAKFATLQTGTVKLVTTSTAPVEIDGLGVSAT